MRLRSKIQQFNELPAGHFFGLRKDFYVYETGTVFQLNVPFFRERGKAQGGSVNSVPLVISSTTVECFSNQVFLKDTVKMAKLGNDISFQRRDSGRMFKI